MQRVLVSLLAVAALALPPAAFAQSSQRDARDVAAVSDPHAPPGYDEVVRLALREFELENYAEARAGFLRAHAMYPNARTLRALGLVAYELKNYTSSIDYLTRALAASERALTSDQRAEVEQLLERARGYVGRYRVSVRPADARLYLDGDLLAESARDVLALSVGDHLLEAQAHGYRPLRRQLQVEGGAEQRIDLVLLPLAAEERAPDPQDSRRGETHWARKKWWLWTTIAVVVAGGVATGLALGLREPEPSEPTGGTTNAVLTLPAED